MRRHTLATIGAAALLAATALSVLPGQMAQGAAAPQPVEYVRHQLRGSFVVAGVLADRPGDFHSVRLGGGTEIYLPLRPEGPSWVFVELVDYACPAGTTLGTFSAISCSRLGGTEASGEVSAPFSEDVIGTSARLRASVPVTTPGGGALDVDVRFAVVDPQPLSLQQLASDSTYTWRYLDNYSSSPFSDSATATGEVAGIPVSGSNVRATSAFARWGVARGRAPRPGDIQPPEPGWKLDDQLEVDGWADAVFSKTGPLAGHPGNFHVFDWYVNTHNWANEVEVDNYRCPDPVAVDVDDPGASGCVAKAASHGVADTSTWGIYKVGQSLALPYNGSTPKLSQAGTPSLTFAISPIVYDDIPFPHHRAGLHIVADCSLSGTAFWDGVGSVRLASTRITVHSCSTATSVHYRPED